MQAQYYGEKAIAVIGDTRPWKEDLKNFGGSWNTKLSIGAGWIFSRQKEAALISFIEKANAGQVVPTVNSGGTSTYQNNNYQNNNYQVQSRTGTVPALSPKTALARLQSLKTNTPAPVTMLPPMPLQISYPNVFTAADGLDYQVIIMTLPIPKVGQTVLVSLKNDSDEMENYQYVVTEVNSGFPINDIYIQSTVAVEEGQPIPTSQVLIINGLWKISCMEADHTITFQ